MSIEVMSAVWDHSTAYGGDLLIMLAIANYADVNGRAFPSIRTLAHRGRMTERNAQYCIQKLEALGELKVQRNAGPHGTHIFQILVRGEKFSGGCKVFTHQKKRNRNKELTLDSTEIRGENISGVQTFRTETHFTGGVKPISPEPSLDPSVLQERSNEPLPSTSDDSEETPKPQPPKPRKNVPKIQEPGELHPNTVEAVKAMMVQRFHLLAEPTKANEVFWDSQIAFLQDANVLSFTSCLKRVDAYWSADPQKVAMKAPGLRRQMKRGIEIEVEKAQKSMKGIRRYAN